MIVSSTPTALLKQALETHGLLSYFKDVVFVGDVGRGKEHADCYLAARRRLGTPRADTWVFEDAPFGVRSAARAGFPTVAVVNDHDGRDERFMETWGTVVAHSYAELSFELLATQAPRVTNALLVAGSPEPSSPELVRALAAQSDYVVAVDKGTDALERAGVVPDAFCGDKDSASSDALGWVRAADVFQEVHPVEKYDTDLGLAFKLARRQAEARGSALAVTLTCASGGRVDRMLGVWGVAARNASARVQIVEDGFEARVLSPVGEESWFMGNEVGATVSVVALAPHTLVTEEGMRWNLSAYELELLGDLGISNRVLSPQACISCDSGVLVAIRVKHPTR